MNYSSVPEIEIIFFNRIKSLIDVMVDAGAREDIVYIENSSDRPREFHLFEPDPVFVDNCKNKLANRKDLKQHKILLNKKGLGNKNGIFNYYPNTQSFVFRKHVVTSTDEGIQFETKRLDDYCDENGIKAIDFIKIDVEGMEIDVLDGGKKIIEKTAKIIQFEFGGTILDRDISIDDLLNWFDKKTFSIYLQNDNYLNDGRLLVEIDNDMRLYLERNINNTLNLVAVRNYLREQVLNLCNEN